MVYYMIDDGPKKIYSVRLTLKMARFLRKIGIGNMSRGVRDLVKKASSTEVKDDENQSDRQ